MIYGHKLVEQPVYRVICPDPALLRKIENIARGVLTLIALIFAACVVVIAIDLCKKTSTPLPPAKPALTDSEVGRSTRERVLAEYQKKPCTTPQQFGDATYYQPPHPQLTGLVHQFWTVNFPALTQALKGKDPWQLPAVIQAAKTCEEVAYTISYLALENMISSIGARAAAVQQLPRSDAERDAEHTVCEMIKAANPLANPLYKSYEGHALLIYKNICRCISHKMYWKDGQMSLAQAERAILLLRSPKNKREQLFADYEILEKRLKGLATEEVVSEGVCAILTHDIGPPRPSEPCSGPFDDWHYQHYKALTQQLNSIGYPSLSQSFRNA